MNLQECHWLVLVCLNVEHYLVQEDEERELILVHVGGKGRVEEGREGLGGWEGEGG